MHQSEERLLKGLRWMGDSQNIIRDTHGNLSERVSNQGMFIKPSGMPYREIIRAVYVPFYSAIKSDLKPSVDWVHHKLIYQKHPWVKAICHTHSPHATSFAIRGSHIRCRCTEHADYFGHIIRCLPYSDLNEWGENVELAQISTEEHEKAILLAKHGTLTFADDPVQAVKLAIALENIAEKTNYASAFGTSSVTGLDDKETDKWHKRYTEEYGQG